MIFVERNPYRLKALRTPHSVPAVGSDWFSSRDIRNIYRLPRCRFYNFSCCEDTLQSPHRLPRVGMSSNNRIYPKLDISLSTMLHNIHSGFPSRSKFLLIKGTLSTGTQVNRSHGKPMADNEPSEKKADIVWFFFLSYLFFLPLATASIVSRRMKNNIT